MDPDGNRVNLSGPGVSLAVALSKFIKKMRRLDRRAAQLEEEICCLADDFQVVVEAILAGNQDISPNLPNLSKARARRHSSDADKREREKAALGVSNVTVTRQPDGYATVSIECYQEFTLPPILSDLLTLLCGETGRSDDDLVGWKTKTELALSLSKRTGTNVTERAIIQNLYRLRKCLAAAGVSPYLIQSNRRKGYRFAKKSKMTFQATCERL